MAVHFSVPASPKRSILTIDEFLGADFTNSPASADINKSPNCINMIRDVPGKVRKCMGYETIDDYSPFLDGGYLLRPFVDREYSTPDLLWYQGYQYGVMSVKEGDYLKVSNDGSGIYVYMQYRIKSTETFSDRTVRIEYWLGNQSDWENTYDDEYKTMLINLWEMFGDSQPIENMNYVDYFEVVQYGVVPTVEFSVVKVSASPGVHNEYYYPKLVMIFPNMSYTNIQVPVCEDLAGGVEDLAIIPPASMNINGFHKLRSDDKGILHIGSYIMRDRELLYDNANDARSKSWEFDDHLFFVDGKQFMKCGYVEPKSDTKFSNDKLTNEVVKDDEVTLIIKRYPKKGDALKITAKSTTSSNGKFAVSKDKRTITYTDKLSTVGQSITYSCSWKYKKKGASSYTNGSISTHTLRCISDEKYFSVNPVSDDAYVPIFDIARKPNGEGSESYEDLNLLTPWFEEDFAGEASVKDYHLSFDNLDEVEPIVEVMDNNGEFQELIYSVDYSIDYETGVVTFVTAPGVSPDGSSDNVKIKACKTFEKYQDRINKCTVGALYGVNGSLDRLFLSGNPDYLNYDWHSELNDPTYFKDTSYATLGSSSSAIIGYSIINNYLAAHKDRYERDQNIILREGDLVDNQPAFRIINTLQGAGAVAPFSFAYLATEPLFLTEQGIYAVTAQDITGEKYAQDRSFFLNGRLLQEENLKDAYAITYNDMYLLCINDVVYILDGLQPIRTDRAEPYATRQYAGFYRTNVPARVMWEDGGRLFFGTDDGKVCRFFNDKYSNESYNDNGEVIEANWETPDIIGKVFFKNKTLRHIAVKLDSSISTSVNIYVMNRGLYNFVKTEGRLRELWDFVGTDNTRARFLSFANLIFSRFTFSNDQTQHTLPTKVRVKKVDKFRLKLTNDQLNEPFGLFDIGFEYVESGNYKG